MSNGSEIEPVSVSNEGPIPRMITQLDSLRTNPAMAGSVGVMWARLDVLIRGFAPGTLYKRMVGGATT